MKKSLIVSMILSLSVFILMLTLVLVQRASIIDDFVYGNVVSRINPMFKNIIIVITNFGGIYFIPFITIGSICIIKDKKVAVMILINLILALSINFSIKSLVQRQRPDVPRLVTETSFSFPSSHAMVSTAFYGLYIYIINKSKISKRSKKICTFLISLLIVLIALSRVYLGVHFTTDIIAGISLAIFYLIIFIEIMEMREKKKEKKKV